ncbi:DNA-binding protein [Neisseria shayeganii]|uniref:DNA-binding protein n=1 Tax=Neisseria shayeganii TaxID=607712 RepID=A0A7D7SI20_9NEIS|nr:DNA-binding protein [Neisseria shayeganii]QMT41272.1 DNA-binding protein [Neisseria shayeganii]
MNEQALFGSVEEALTFAFHYSAEQSPRTPMTALAQGGAIGSGKGLYGVDGAAQAAMILNKLDALPKEQRWALTVRFGDVEHECPCCGHPAKSHEWKDAVDGLSWCVELEGIPKQMRHAMIAKVLCRQKVDLAGMSERYGLARSTTYRQQNELKHRLNTHERQGLDAIRDMLFELLPKAA